MEQPQSKNYAKNSHGGGMGKKNHVPGETQCFFTKRGLWREQYLRFDM